MQSIQFSGQYLELDMIYMDMPLPIFALAQDLGISDTKNKLGFVICFAANVFMCCLKLIFLSIVMPSIIIINIIIIIIIIIIITIDLFQFGL